MEMDQRTVRFPFLWLLLALWATGGIPAGTAASVPQLKLYPSGLKPVPCLPEGVTVDSTTGSLTLRVAWPELEKGKPIALCLVVPPDVLLTPQWDGASATSLTKRCEPSLFVKVQDKGIARFWRLAQITIDPTPAAVRPLKPLSPGLLSVRFDFPKGLALSAPPDERARKEWGFSNILRHVVANPDALPLYASRTQGTPNTETAPSPWLPEKAGLGPCFKILIPEDGLYRLAAHHFKEAGLDPSAISPHSIRVFSRGKTVPTLALGPQSAAFGPEQSVVFSARGSESKFSRDRAYWVFTGGSAASVPVEIPSQPDPGPFPAGHAGVVDTLAELRVEKDRKLLIEHGNFLAIKGFAWVWEQVPEKGECAFPFDLPYADPRTTESIQARLKFFFQSEEKLPTPLPPNSPALLVRVNDSPEIRLDPFKSCDDTSRTCILDRKYLKPAVAGISKGNELRIRFEKPLTAAPQAAEVYIDNFILRYRRNLAPTDGRLEIRTRAEDPWYRTYGFKQPPLVFDLTDPDAPALLPVQALQAPTHAFYEPRPGRRLMALSPDAIPEAPAPHEFAPTSIRDADNEADYLLIYHERFTEQIQPLVAFQKERGFRVRTVEISEVYQEYSAGETTPQAIKDFLLDALRRWRVPPVYVCLFGDATSDYRNELRSGVENLVPTYSYTAQDKDVWASELWFATLIGQDLFPDVVLGRIPARLTQDAEEMVRKVVTYEKNAPMGPWRGRFGYCSDDTGFRDATERLFEEYRPAVFAGERIYLEEFPYVDNFYLPPEVVKAKSLKVSTEATLELLKTYNRGVSLMLFFGHGSPNIWTDERIWFGGDSPNSDNLNMRNGDRLPFVATFTCNQGAFDYPTDRWYICISEDMMRVRKGGAIALYVPSGPGYTQAHEEVAHPLLQALLREKVKRVGECIALSSIYYLLNGSGEEMLRMYVLLGDPALDLVIPEEAEMGRVTPEQVSALELPRKEKMALEAKAGGLQEGRFAAGLYDPDENEVLFEKPMPFSAGRIRWEFDLPQDARPGRWVVRGYYGNDALRVDGVLSASFEVVQPHMAITSLTLRSKPSRRGETAKLALEVRNDSDVPIREANVRFGESRPDAGPREEWETCSVSLKPGEKSVLTFTRKVRDLLSAYEAVPDPAFTQSARDAGSPANGARRVVLDLLNDVMTTTVLTLPGLVRVEARKYDPAADLTVTIPLHYAGFPAPTPCQAQLMNTSGTLLASTSVTLGDGKKPDGKAEAKLNLQAPKESLSAPCRLLITRAVPPRAGNPRPLSPASPLLDLKFRLPAPALPDLRVTPGSITFSPARPIEGETIFMRVQIENAGTAGSGPFQLKLVSKRKGREGLPLQPLPQSNAFSQQGLGAGQKRWVTLRWDYDTFPKNAGVEIVELQIAPGNAVPELDKSNNRAEASIRILKPAQVTILRDEAHKGDVRSVIRDLPENKKEVSLTAVVRNLGETAGKGWHLGFYQKTPDPAKEEQYLDPGFLALDKPLDPIEGLTSRTFTHTWVSPADSVTTPTAVVFKPTLSIRAENMGDSTDSTEW